MVLRILFTLIVQQLFDLPWLKLVGGLILLWIAVELLMGEEANGDSARSGASVWEAVKIVAIADIVMSLDNVLAIAAAAGGHTGLVVVGLVISIPLVVFGATLLTWLLDRLPILVWAGSALLGWVAGELLATAADPAALPHSRRNSLGVAPKVLMHIVEGSAAVLVVLVGWVLTRTSARHTAKQGAE